MAKGMNRVVPFVPAILETPRHLVKVPTAWAPAEKILQDIILRFGIFSGQALEFGVDYGYSIAAIANYFNRVVGVDTFAGDQHAGPRGEDLYKLTKKALKEFKNIHLCQLEYQRFIVDPAVDKERWDLIHIDIVHHYKETNELGAWAVEHSDVVLFHDTISFPDVRRAVQDIAWETGMVFYEWQVGPGLGILVKE